MLRSAILLSAGVATSHAAATAGNPKASNSMTKVIEMMEELKVKVQEEGKQEQKTYDKFARFCTETKEEKADEIETGKEAKDSLEATIKAKASEQEKQTEAISGEDGFEATIAETTKKLADDQKTRKDEQAAYQKANAETEKAISGLDKAIEAMRASKGTAFLQEDTKHEIRAAALLADSLGLASESALDALDAPTQDYNFHSDGIIETLENLQKEFREADMKADEDESKANTAFITAQTALKIALKTAQNGLATATETNAAAKTAEGQAKTDLEETSKELAADTKYLAELTTMCSEKEATFNQRKAAREEELKAVAEATELMKEASSPKKEEGALLIEIAQAAASSPVVLQSAEAEAEAVEKAPSFWQAASRSRASNTLFLQQRVQQVEAGRHLKVQEKKRVFPANQQKLIDMLTEKAKSTRSSRFVLLAQKAASSTSVDVFEEIKKMIIGQINSLQTAQEQALSKKAGCDKRIGESSQKRDVAARKVNELNNELAGAEARIAQNKEDIQKLTDQMAEIAAAVKEAKDARTSEAAESAAAIEEAEHGAEATDAAIKVIKDFYTKNAKNTVSMLEGTQDPAKDAPDAGFKNKEAYKGSQEESSGIMGMLEVVQADFKRAITQTKESEKAAIKDHAKFLSESEVATEEKKQAKTTKSQFVSEDEDKHEQDETGLSTQAGVLKSAVSELGALEEECGPGVSYEERAAARAKEIDQLKDAITLVNEFISKAR